MSSKKFNAHRVLQKALLLVVICIVLFSVSITNAETEAINSVTPPTLDTKLRFVNYAHTSEPLVLNMYGNTPTSGANVTVYVWDDNATQWWRNVYLGKKDPNDSETKYYRLEVYTNSALALNFNQSSTKCTLYPWASNDTYDYELKWLVGNYASYAFRIKLYNRNRLLGVATATSSQCYWYTYPNNDFSNADAEDNWLFYTVI